MKIENVRIYDLEESLIASGYPMRTELKDYTINNDVLKRAKQLCKATATDNGAHGQFLTGIRVSFDLTFTNKAWVEAERYRFLEFVSSQSTMHKITEFNLSNSYNEFVDTRIIAIMEELVGEYKWIAKKLKNKEYENEEEENALKEQLKNKKLNILYSNPSGFQLTARLTTNYRCLRNIWLQRKNHRLPEWVEFCKWIETLPLAQELICFDRDIPVKVSNEELVSCALDFNTFMVNMGVDAEKYIWEFGQII